MDEGPVRLGLDDRAAVRADPGAEIAIGTGRGSG